MIENDTFYLFLFTNKDDSISLMAKLAGGGFKANEIYKVYDSGTRDFGMGTMYTKILKNTAQEVIVEHAGEGMRSGTPRPIVTTYRVLAGKPQLEVRPVERVNQQGMHGKSRICAFVKLEEEDFILDSKREPFTQEVNYHAPEGTIGLINFSRRFRQDHDFVWFMTFPPEAARHRGYYLTYLGFHADPFWEDGKSDRPSVGAQYAYLDSGGVFIGVLNDPDNWKREDVGKQIGAGEVYQTDFKAPYAGEWKMVARMDDRYIHSRVRIDEAGQGFTFRGSEGGMLDYILVYLWDRTDKTPKELFTPMDVYRETILGPETGVGDCGESGAVPGSYALYPNRPNPFNPDTEIGYALPEGTVRCWQGRW
jgi:hypothetical protein